MKPHTFENVVLPLGGTMHRLARALLADKAGADDLVQDVLERLWLRRDALGQVSNPSAFVLRSVRNACYDVLRRRELRRTEPIDAAAARSADLPCDDAELLRAAMRTLAPIQREVFVLRDVEGYEFREIAETLDLTEANVRVILSRTRRLLAERIKTMDAL